MAQAVPAIWRRLRNLVDDPVTKENRDKSIRAYAIARFAAIQLACGKECVSAKADTDEWDGSGVYKNPNRKNPIIWLPKSALLLEAADDFAPYGRRPGKDHEGVKTVSITRRAALHDSEVTARDFENIGDSPFLSGYFPFFVGEPKRVANSDGNIAASAKGRSDMSDLWLVDTGCGHVLVSITNVKLSKGETERLEHAVAFQTASGDTPSTHVAPIFFSELNETIEPYVLKEAPSFISVGDGTVNKGCSYMWKAGCNPYLITLEEKGITCEVIRDIPYLRKNSEFCQPRDATDEEFRFHALPSREGSAAAADDNVDGAQPSEGGGEHFPPVPVPIEDVSGELEELDPVGGISERRLCP